MIDFAFKDFVKTLTLSGGIFYGNANNKSTPYTVFFKVEDPERPDLLCEDQGDSGKALFVFQHFRGGQGSLAEDQETALLNADSIKRQIAEKKGIISYGAQSYRIWHNKTTGVVPIGNGANEGNFFGAQFTVLLYWNIIN